MTESFQPAGTFEAGANTGENFRDGLVADYLCAVTPDDEGKALKALRKDEFRLAMAGMTPEQRETWNTLDKVDWKAVQREGLTAVMPLLFGAYLGLTMDTEAATKLTTSIGFGGIILAEASTVARLVENQAKFPKAGRLAKAVAAVRIGTFYAGKVGLFAALGTGAGALVHRGWEAQAAAPAAAGGGEGFNNPHPEPRPVDASIGQAGGLSPEDRGVGAVIQPPADVATANEATQAAQAAAQQAAADTASRQVAEALKESQLAAAPVGITGGELSGGTIWGNELEFVKQLGVHHVEPVTNLLKNFSKVLAQAQPATEIGPTDTAYVINRDVAEWAAGQMDQLYNMDPSSMSSWQKGLWEIGRGLREANWRDLQAVTEEFVRQAKP